MFFNRPRKRKQGEATSAERWLNTVESGSEDEQRGSSKHQSRAAKH